MIDESPNLPAVTPPEREFLEAFFSDALASVQDGRPVDVDGALAGREHLRVHVEHYSGLARRISGETQPVSLPRVDGYTILREVGRGGMGVVYLARQERLRRDVALKVLLPQYAMSPSSRERFGREASLIAGLRHLSIVSIYDLVSDRSETGEERQMIAMEWVDGRSLAALIGDLAEMTPKGRAPTMSDAAVSLNGQIDPHAIKSWEAFVCRVGIATARALQALHDADLLHRDIKPSNILIRKDGQPLLSDFGLVANSDDHETGKWTEPPSTTRASSTRSASQTTAPPGQSVPRPHASRDLRVDANFVGTAAYAAPEQLRGQTVGKRTDIYGLGVSLAHAACLRCPFNALDPAAILHQITTGRRSPIRDFIPDASPDLDAVIARATAPAAADRYASAADLADDLERVLRGESIRAHGPLAAVRRLLARNRRTLLAGAAILALLVCAAFFAGYLAAAPR